MQVKVKELKALIRETVEHLTEAFGEGPIEIGSFTGSDVRDKRYHDTIKVIYNPLTSKTGIQISSGSKLNFGTPEIDRTIPLPDSQPVTIIRAIKKEILDAKNEMSDNLYLAIGAPHKNFTWRIGNRQVKGLNTRNLKAALEDANQRFGFGSQKNPMLKSRLEDVVLQSALEIAGGPRKAVMLDKLRSKLGKYGKVEIDKALNKLEDDGKIVLYREDDNRALTPELRASALIQSGEPRHLLYVLN